MSESTLSRQTTLLPWHREVFAHIWRLRDSGRLGHAWLLGGHAGTGKLQFGLHLAGSLLCEQGSSAGPCDHCSACHLFAVGTHPDFHPIRPEKRLITIEQIREGIEFAQNTSQRNGMKVLLLEPAEAMNGNAANALLKLLEEPPARTLLLLVCHQPGLLLATIRSRCQLLRCPLPDTAQALAWLRQQRPAGNTETALRKASGAPLLALTWLDADQAGNQALVLATLQEVLSEELPPLVAARRCEKLDLPAILDYLLRGTTALLQHLQAAVALPDDEFAPLAARLTQRLDTDEAVRRLHDLYQAMQSSRQTALASNNANRLLLLESCFVRWRRLLRTERARPQLTHMN